MIKRKQLLNMAELPDLEEATEGMKEYEVSLAHNSQSFVIDSAQYRDFWRELPESFYHFKDKQGNEYDVNVRYIVCFCEIPFSI